MNPLVCRLQLRTREYTLETFVTDITWAYAVTMSNEATQPVIFPENWLTMHGDPQLFFEVTERPQIVIASVVVNGDPRIDNACDGAEQPHTSFGYGMLVFKPKIEHVTDKVNLCSRTCYSPPFAMSSVLQPSDEAQLAYPAFAGIGSTKVQV
jgi:hypothetical protein